MSNVLSDKVVIACEMGPETASGVVLALKTGKPVILLNCPDEAAVFFRGLAPGRVWITDTVAQTMGFIHNII